MNLRVPGPTPLPDDVLEAMARPMINHRGPEFASLMSAVEVRLKEFFQTEGNVLLFTASGTGGLEAAVVNTLSPSDRVLAVSIGYFGERFAAIAEAFGADLTRLNFPWGLAADPARIEAELKAAQRTKRPYKLFLITHNETSTGVTNDLKAITEMLHSFQEMPLIIVDAISSLGAIDLPAERWGCDIVITGSQKAWMAPPGLAMVSVSKRAWKVAEQARAPRFYWDFFQMKEYADRHMTPFTPAVSVLYALRRSLEMMAEEGLENIFARHKRIGKLMREGVKELGLELLADEAHASDTLTAVRMGRADEVRKRLHEEHGIVVAGGQGPLKGKIIRIGHMGYVSEGDIEAVLEGLRKVL